MRSAGTEAALYDQLAEYLAYKHPELDGLVHFDLAGVWTPSHQARNLYGRINRRAWPDLFIALPVFYPGSTVVSAGLFIELKRQGTRVKKRDGTWASPHMAEQAITLNALADAGYIAQFAVGFEEAVRVIESYLRPAKTVDVSHGTKGRHTSHEGVSNPDDVPF